MYRMFKVEHFPTLLYAKKKLLERIQRRRLQRYANGLGVTARMEEVIKFSRKHARRWMGFCTGSSLSPLFVGRTIVTTTRHYWAIVGRRQFAFAITTDVGWGVRYRKSLARENGIIFWTRWIMNDVCLRIVKFSLVTIVFIAFYFVCKCM